MLIFTQQLIASGVFWVEVESWDKYFKRFLWNMHKTNADLETAISENSCWVETLGKTSVAHW